ncbi:hypothetical protein VP1G_03474 [Cytospora mali]|uniref:DUF6923 domain-containing protein n=1 Tax=Cytospora mali TaxID=578113 RepID=A0A194UWW7_CYTMA|nr:hypothetical protein VP1G_03474 [Valsa mali var. pyri (nom. inval.)]
MTSSSVAPPSSAQTISTSSSLPSNVPSSSSTYSSTLSTSLPTSSSAGSSSSSSIIGSIGLPLPTTSSSVPSSSSATTSPTSPSVPTTSSSAAPSSSSTASLTSSLSTTSSVFSSVFTSATTSSGSNTSSGSASVTTSSSLSTNPSSTTASSTSASTPAASVNPYISQNLTRFACDGTAYETQSKSLYSLSLASGSYSAVGASNLFTDTVNALAYHPVENYLYAVAQNNRQYGYIVRIGAGGYYNIVPNGNIPQTGTGTPTSMTSGDIDSNSYYWLAYNSGQNWVQVDLNSGSPTYGQVLNNGSTTGLSTLITVSDWAYIPAYPNKLFAIGGQSMGAGTYSSYLLSFDMTTKAWTSLQTYSGLAGGVSATLVAGQAAWGAIYTTSDGFLWATENYTGRIYKFQIASPSASGFIYVSQGPAGTTNDGARCMNGPTTVTKKRTVNEDSGFQVKVRKNKETRDNSKKNEE